MSEEIPPWEDPMFGIPDELVRAIEEARETTRAKDAAIMDAPYVASQHAPVWDYIEDEDDYPSFLGCLCGISTVGRSDDWGPHVDELQRRDRERVWTRGYMRSYSLERGWDTHEAKVPDRLDLAEDNPYTKKED